MPLPAPRLPWGWGVGGGGRRVGGFRVEGDPPPPSAAALLTIVRSTEYLVLSSSKVNLWSSCGDRGVVGGGWVGGPSLGVVSGQEGGCGLGRAAGGGLSPGPLPSSALPFQPSFFSSSFFFLS